MSESAARCAVGGRQFCRDRHLGPSHVRPGIYVCRACARRADNDSGSVCGDRVSVPSVGRRIRYRQFGDAGDTVLTVPSVFGPYEHVRRARVVPVFCAGRADHDRIFAHGCRCPEPAAGDGRGRVQRDPSVVPFGVLPDENVGCSGHPIMVSRNTDHQHFSVHGDRVTEAVSGWAVKGPERDRIRKRRDGCPSVRRHPEQIGRSGVEAVLVVVIARADDHHFSTGEYGGAVMVIRHDIGHGQLSMLGG